MKKQDYKKENNYKEKPFRKTCSNCFYFKSEFVKNEFGFVEEKNIRCGLYQFSVKKTANCDVHLPK